MRFRRVQHAGRIDGIYRCRHKPAAHQGLLFCVKCSTLLAVSIVDLDVLEQLGSEKINACINGDRGSFEVTQK